MQLASVETKRTMLRLRLVRHCICLLLTVDVAVSFTVNGVTPRGVVVSRNTMLFRPRSRTALNVNLPTLEDRFEKWRFLQDLMDGEVDGDVINTVLYKVLAAYRALTPSSDKGSSSASPEMTPELAASIDAIIESSDGDKIPVISEVADEKLLLKLEDLLPDPVEDEDGHKSAWDTVMELHGRDMVQANETNPTPEWRALCLVARLMVHYDFLSKQLV